MQEITLGRVSDTRAATQSVRYQERLRVPWWWWLPAFGLAGLIALEVNQGVAGACPTGCRSRYCFPSRRPC